MKNNSGNAFPIYLPNGDILEGISKREYYASMALSGLCASIKYRPTTEPAPLVKSAIVLADLLIGELEK